MVSFFVLFLFNTVLFYIFFAYFPPAFFSAIQPVRCNGSVDAILGVIYHLFKYSEVVGRAYVRKGGDVTGGKMECA